MKDNTKGTIMAVSSYVIWGLMPIYWQALKPIDSGIIILYRIVLVAIVSFAGALKTDGWEEIKKTIRQKKAVLYFLSAGIFITLNWGLYVWAVNAGFIIQTSMGHYIEPLMIALTGIILFKEKLTKSILISLCFAGTGIIIMLVHYGELPMIALGLGSTFAIYAAIKKKIHCSSIMSLFYETVFFVPLAAAGIIYVEVKGIGAFAAATKPEMGLLMTVGIVTVAVLWLFAESEKKTSMSVIGIAGYLAPTISFFLGVFVYNEPIDQIELIAFAVIWVGLAVFVTGTLGAKRIRRRNSIRKYIDNED